MSKGSHFPFSPSLFSPPLRFRLRQWHYNTNVSCLWILRGNSHQGKATVPTGQRKYL
ncbi:hypothetical protein PM082_023387 [Marasmius tenuissimus]|nr:hypothetical protein PM082_023387 [Marasmius tenuissimus]